MSEYFPNARDFTLNNPNFSNVGRDQYVHHHHTTITTTAQTKSRLWIQGTEQEEGEFEQYYEVKRADLQLTQSVCSTTHRRSRWDEDEEILYEKKVFIGQALNGIGQGSSVTVVGYEGPEAREAWLEDFKRCTGFLSVDRAHLLAISRSKIPLLIFASGLVPAAQFLVNVGTLGRAYFNMLSFQLGCGWRESEVWMDPQKGVLCRGPQGPDVRVGPVPSNSITNIPSSVELLQEDICVRFLASKEADDFIVQVHLGLSTSPSSFSSSSHSSSSSINFQHTAPTVIFSLTNTPIASAAEGLSWGPEHVLENGDTRFTYIDPSANVYLYPSHSGLAWLSQAWSIFHALGVSLEDDLSQFKLIEHHISLKLPFSPSKYKHQRRRGWSIFLFIRRLPSTPFQPCTTTSLHYWSYDEDGQSPLPTNMCHYLGLPVALELKVHHSRAFSWSNDDYRRIHQYQVARGFDPSTMDFARSVGHDDPVFKPIQNDSDRFEEVNVMQVTDPIYSRPSSPPVPYRSQIPDESDIDTDDDYSDTTSNFYDSHREWLYGQCSPETVDDLCICLGNLALD